MSTSDNGNQSSAGRADYYVSTTVVTWRALDSAHGKLSDELSAALRTHHNLSLNAHAVLAQLVRAPDRKLRMTEIASRIDFSLSGLTGLVGRLEQDGLIERQSNAADRRVIYACLTEIGERYANEADTRHQATLDTILSERFEPDELALLAELLGRITANGEA